MLSSTRHSLALTAHKPAGLQRSVLACRRQQLRVAAKLGDQPGATEEKSSPEQGSFGVRPMLGEGLNLIHSSSRHAKGSILLVLSFYPAATVRDLPTKP